MRQIKNIFASLALASSILWSGIAKSQTAADEEPTLAQPPKLLKAIEAAVPAGTKFPAAPVEVLLEIIVTTEGKVSSVKILQGAGEPFDQAAQQAASKFEFSPALLSNGERAEVAVNFRLRIARPVLGPVAAPPPPSPPVDYRGRLVERGTRRPLIGVEVQALAEGRVLFSSVSDEQGYFSLLVNEPEFNVRATPGGHQSLNAKVQARPGEKREETFLLEATGNGQVTIVRSEKVKREVTKQVLPKEIVEKLPGTAGDTLKVVQILPGVARASFDGGQLILRGASPGDSRTFLEGQEIPSLYHFGGLRSSFNPIFLDSVDFLPGNFGPDYGRAMGGIVDIKIRNPANDMLRGLIDINFYDATAALEGPVSKNWSVGGAFRRSYIDTILPAVLPDDAPLSFNSAPRFYDYQFLAAYQPSAREQLRLIYYGALDKVSLLFDRPQSDPKIRGNLSARVMFHNLYGSYRYRFSPQLIQETSAQIGLQELQTAIGPDLYFKLNIAMASLRHAWTYAPRTWLTARAGIDVRLDQATIDLNSPLRPIEGEDPPPISTRETYALKQETGLYEPAAFAEIELKPITQLTLIPSLRLDYYKYLERWTVDPRFVARYQIFPQVTLKGGLGLYQQPPTPDQVNEELGNPRLLALRSTHTSLGAEYTWRKIIDAELTGFYKWLDRQVSRNPDYFTNAAALAYLNQGSGRIYGAEVLLRARLEEKFLAWVAYTYQRSFRTDRPDQTERLFDFDQPHILTIVGSYKFSRGWTLGARFRLVSGNPSTPVLYAIYDSASDTWVPVYGEKNSQRQDAFHQLDVRLDKEWIFRAWRLTAYLDVQNAYNHQNQEGISYSYDYRAQQILSGLPILPILGVKGEW